MIVGQEGMDKTRLLSAKGQPIKAVLSQTLGAFFIR
jgi:hypothetical protein